MSPGRGDLTSVLVLRAWLEGGSPHRLRVRIIRLRDHGEQSATAVATVEAACAAVQGWLNELLEVDSVPKPPRR